MKIALIDNMNNNFFALARYFKDLGHVAHLYLIERDDLAHFKPEHDTYEDLSNADWIKMFPLNYKWNDLFKGKSILSETFESYDLIISCGLATGLLYAAGIKTDAFIPYGSDLMNIPFGLDVQNKNILKKLILYPLLSYRTNIQKKGIKNSRIIISNSNWEHANNALKIIGRESVNLPRVMVYPEKLAGNDSRWDYMDEYDFVVFSPTRHLWKTNAEHLTDFHQFGGAKRNDKLIHAFKNVIDLKLYSNPLLVLSEYGADVLYTKKLISELAMSEYVKWMPIMPRKILIQGMKRSTFIADQFREGMSATSAGTTNEALAVGVPVITNTDGAINKQNDPYFNCPILEALTVDEITEYFVSYSNCPGKFKEIGRVGKQWFSENLGIGLAQSYIDLMV